MNYLNKMANNLYSLITPNIYNRYKYFITFFDKITRYLEVKLLKIKDEAFNVFYK